MLYRPQHIMATIIFIDIDGTVTDGSKREELVTAKGLVIGEYGSPNRKYPFGKHQFLMSFNHKDIFHLDSTLPYSEDFITILSNFNPDDCIVFWLTARDVIYHEAIRTDLEDRGLWFDGMRLICKSHASYCKTIDYKINIIREIVTAAKPTFCLYVENESRLREAAVDLNLDIFVVENCKDAVESLNSNIIERA